MSHRYAVAIASLACYLMTAPAWTSVAMAFCLQPDPPRVCAEYFVSSLVFTGTVLSIKDVPEGEPEKDYEGGWMFRLKVLKMYRGQAVPTIEVFSENTSARFPLKKGESYLLFVRRYGSTLEITSCGNSSEIARAGAAIKQLDSLLSDQKSKSEGDIGGKVIENYNPRPDGLAGVEVIAEGDRGKFHTTSASDGAFNIRVPAGKYSVSAQRPGWKIIPYDISFEDPSNITVPGGGCADMEFNVLEKR